MIEKSVKWRSGNEGKEWERAKEERKRLEKIAKRKKRLLERLWRRGDSEKLTAEENEILYALSKVGGKMVLRKEWKDKKALRPVGIEISSPENPGILLACFEISQIELVVGKVEETQVTIKATRFMTEGRKGKVGYSGPELVLEHKGVRGRVETLFLERDELKQDEKDSLLAAIIEKELDKNLLGAIF